MAHALQLFIFGRAAPLMTSVLALLGLENKLTLTPWQTEVYTLFLNNIKEEKVQATYRYALCGAHGVGKTTLGALIILTHLVLCSYCYKDKSYRAVCFAGSEKQLKQSLWADIDLLIRLSTKLPRLIEYSQQKISLKTDNKFAAHARACNLNNVQSMAGIHAEQIMIVVDEATAVGDAAFQKMETFFTSGSAHWLIMANPTTTIGYFYQTFSTVNSWYTRVINRFDIDKNDPFARDMLERYGEDSDEYRVRVLGLFPLTESGGLISRYILDMATDEDRYTDNTQGPYLMGIDVSTGEGANYSAFAVFNAVRAIELYREKIRHDEYLSMLRATIDSYARKNKIYVGIDSIGVGFGLYQTLLAHYAHNKQVMIVPIKGNDPPKTDNLNYRNKRVELFFNLRSWLKDTGYIPDLILKNRLFDELQCIKLEMSNGLINLKSKKEIDEPVDLADAAAYAFAFGNLAAQRISEPVPRRSSLTFHNYLLTSNKYISRNTISSKYD